LKIFILGGIIMRFYIIPFFLFINFSFINSMIPQGIARDYCSSICETIIENLDPEAGSTYSFDELQALINGFLLEESFEDPVLIIDKEKVRKFLLKKREKLFSRFNIEGVSKEAYESTVNNIIQPEPRDRFKTCLNIGIKFIGLILIVAVVYYLYLQVKKLRDMDLGVCANEFKQCVSEQFGDFDVPDMPDIPDGWWDILPDFN
jgi:hypothetical protein